MDGALSGLAVLDWPWVMGTGESVEPPQAASAAAIDTHSRYLPQTTENTRAKLLIILALASPTGTDTNTPRIQTQQASKGRMMTASSPLERAPAAPLSPGMIALKTGGFAPPPRGGFALQQRM
jgi:hypothetical protein